MVHGVATRATTKFHANVSSGSTTAEETPIGTISYVCKGDLSLETQIERARAIVAAGSEFAIVGDLERLEHRVYRMDGVKIETDKFTLPEMPWFDVPKILARDD